MNKTGSILYYAYGSNMSAKKMTGWSMGAQFVSNARLDDWCISMDKKGKDGFARATIVNRLGEHVWGVVYKIPKANIERLDSYEGLGRGYQAEWVEVVTPEGRILKVYTYVGLNLKKGLLIHGWYRDYIIKGAQEHNLPKEYVTKLEGILRSIMRNI